MKEGVRDGVVARATHDYLFAFRHGQVSATLDLLSIDLKTRTIVITRNAESPMLQRVNGMNQVVPVRSSPIGRYRWTKPVVSEVVLFTDGIWQSGRRSGQPPIDLEAFADDALGKGLHAQELADRLLTIVIERDEGRPNDDMAVVTLRMRAGVIEPAIRKMSMDVSIP